MFVRRTGVVRGLRHERAPERPTAFPAHGKPSQAAASQARGPAQRHASLPPVAWPRRSSEALCPRGLAPAAPPPPRRCARRRTRASLLRRAAPRWPCRCLVRGPAGGAGAGAGLDGRGAGRGCGLKCGAGWERAVPEPAVERLGWRLALGPHAIAKAPTRAGPRHHHSRARGGGPRHRRGRGRRGQHDGAAGGGSG